MLKMFCHCMWAVFDIWACHKLSQSSNGWTSTWSLPCLWRTKGAKLEMSYYILYSCTVCICMCVSSYMFLLVYNTCFHVYVCNIYICIYFYICRYLCIYIYVYDEMLLNWWKVTSLTLSVISGFTVTFPGGEPSEKVQDGWSFSNWCFMLV